MNDMKKFRILCEKSTFMVFRASPIVRRCSSNMLTHLMKFRIFSEKIIVFLNFVFSEFWRGLVLVVAYIGEIKPFLNIPTINNTFYHFFFTYDTIKHF